MSYSLTSYSMNINCHLGLPMNRKKKQEINVHRSALK